MASARPGSSTTSPATDPPPADGAAPGTRAVAIGPVRIGGGHPLALLAGPCAIEGESEALRAAEALVRIADDRFALSYDDL
jgi:hypothetical protein